MAYDEDLVNRIRELLGSERGVEEKRMFRPIHRSKSSNDSRPPSLGWRWKSRTTPLWRLMTARISVPLSAK